MKYIYWLKDKSILIVTFFIWSIYAIGHACVYFLRELNRRVFIFKENNVKNIPW